MYETYSHASQCTNCSHVRHCYHEKDNWRMHRPSYSIFSKCLKTSKEKEELICWSRKLFLTIKGYQLIKYYMIPSKDIHKIHVIIVLLVTSIVWSSGLQTASHLNTATNEVGVIVSILPVQNGIRKIIHLFACFWDYNLITTFLHSLSSL